MNRSNRLLTIDETAQLLHVSRPTVYRLIRTRALLPVRIGHRLRFEPTEIQRYVDASRQRAAIRP